MKLIRIGDRLLNIDAITHASFDEAHTYPATEETFPECCISFAGDDCCILYGPEAVRMWGYLTDYAGNLNPRPHLEEAIAHE